MHDFAKLHVEDWAKRHGLLAGIALLFAATLAWLGAFGSHDFEPFARVGYWTVIFLVQYGLAAVTMPLLRAWRSEEHTSELQSLMRISYAVFCLKKQKKRT